MVIGGFPSQRARKLDLWCLFCGGIEKKLSKKRSYWRFCRLRSWCDVTPIDPLRTTPTSSYYSSSSYHHQYLQYQHHHHHHSHQHRHGHHIHHHHSNRHHYHQNHHHLIIIIIIISSTNTISIIIIIIIIIIILSTIISIMIVTDNVMLYLSSLELLWDVTISLILHGLGNLFTTIFFSQWTIFEKKLKQPGWI